MRPGHGAKVPGRAREGGEVQGAGHRGESGRSQGIKAVEGAEKSVGGKNQDMTSGETEGTGSHRKNELKGPLQTLVEHWSNKEVGNLKFLLSVSRAV